MLRYIIVFRPEEGLMLKRCQSPQLLNRQGAQRIIKFGQTARFKKAHSDSKLASLGRKAQLKVKMAVPL